MITNAIIDAYIARNGEKHENPGSLAIKTKTFEDGQEVTEVRFFTKGVVSGTDDRLWGWASFRGGHGKMVAAMKPEVDANGKPKTMRLYFTAGSMNIKMPTDGTSSPFFNFRDCRLVVLPPREEEGEGSSGAAEVASGAASGGEEAPRRRQRLI